jgi:hypothetical protein
MSLGGQTLTSATGTDSDIYLAKFTSAGVHMWSKSFGATLNDGDLGVDVAVDGSSNVILTGNYYGSVNFGGGALPSDGGTSDVFVLKLNPSGGHVWSKRFGGPGQDRPNSVGIRGTGEVFVAGAFQENVNFGGGALASASPTTFDIFVLKLDANGNHVFSRRFGDVGNDQARGIAVDRSGNAYVAGLFSGTVDFGLGAATAQGIDAFALKMTTSGTTSWTKTFGGTGSDNAVDVAVDSTANVYVTGFFRGTADFGGGAVTSQGASDAFLTSYTTLGAYRWSRTAGAAAAANSNEQGNGVTADAAGNVAVTGSYDNPVDFGGGALPHSGSADVFIARYAADGTLVWAGGFGGAGADTGFSVSQYRGALVATGNFFSTAIDLGGGPLSNAGGADIWIARFIY